MRGRRVALLAAVSLASAALAVPAAADAAAPQVTELRVVGGDVWSPENRFDLLWNLALPAGTPLSAVAGVNYTLEPRSLEPPTWMPGPKMGVQNVHIQPAIGSPAVAPGSYRMRVWAGPDPAAAESVWLRFDDQPPAAAKPLLPVEWIRGDVEPVLRIEHPAGPLPVAGIRGYAVAVRPGSGAPPCAGAERCSVEETDLWGGIGGDAMPLGRLPEGRYAVSVVAVSNSGMRSPQAETAMVKVDATRPDLQLTGTGGAWSNQPVRVVARATDPLSGMAPSGPSGPRTAISVDGAAATVAQGGEAVAVVAGSGVHSVSASARDAAGNARGEDPSSPPSTDLVRIDETPPAVWFARDSDPGEPELLEASVGDALSGPASGRGSIAVRPLGSGRAFEQIPTRDEGGRLVARWDSDSYPHGSYEFRATGYDLAGNLASSRLRVDGREMVLANPVKVPTAIRFGFGGERLVWQRCVRIGEGRRCHRQVIDSFEQRPAERIVPYGQGLRVAGRLVSASGTPLAGYAVDLVESFEAGSTMPPRTTTATTGSDGVFTARLGPGPSRRVEARFGGAKILTHGASRALRLGVRTAVRLRASAAWAPIGGIPVLFTGQVPHLGAEIPEYGRPVQFQFRLPGAPWTEFRTVQTDAQGRFRFPYAFTDDDSRGVRFRFRAFAPPQPGWPYEPAASRPVAVTGY